MRRINLIVKVADTLWMMESMAASRHPDMIEIVDELVSMNYKTREATSKSGTVYRIYIDNSVGVLN